MLYGATSENKKIFVLNLICSSLSLPSVLNWVKQGIPSFSVLKPCSACSRVFAGDIYGDHVVSCAGIIGIKHRHNVVRDTLVDRCYRYGISVDGGLDVCVDLTRSSPLTQTGMVDFVPNRAVIDAAQRKRNLDLGERNIKQCKRKICDGNYTAAVRVLSSSSVAPYNDATLKDLKSKHPFKHAPSLPHTPTNHHHLIAFPAAVLDRIKSFPRGTVVMIGHSLDGYLDDIQFGVGASGGDDGTIVGDTLVVGKVLELIIEDGSCCGLHFNIDKTKRIVTASRPGFGDWQWRLATLPFSYGGLGVYSAGDVLNYAFIASRFLLQGFTRDIYGDHVVSCVGKEVDIRLGGGCDKPLLPGDMLVYSWDGGLDVCVDLTESSPLTQTGLTNFWPIDLGKDAMNLLKRIRKFSVTQDIGARAAVHIFNRISFAIAKGVGAQLMALWKSQMEDHTSDWLKVVLISGLGQTMNGRTYRCVLCYRLGVPLFSVPKPCSACSRVFVADINGDHAVSYADGKEVDIRLGGGRDKPLRPADMLLNSQDGGLNVCVNLTGIGYGFLPFSFSSFEELKKEAVTLLKRIRRFSMTQDIWFRGRHCNGKAQAITKHSLLTDLVIFERAEVTLKRMRIWLCGVCFKIHTLGAKCHHGKSSFMSPPDSGDGVVHIVLYDLKKPRVSFCSEQLNHVKDLLHNQHRGFSIALLDSLFSKRLRTIKSIPPKCRLGFSRVKKGALNKVIFRVLPSFGVAPYNDATLKDFMSKHPFKPAPSLPHTPTDHHHLIASPTIVLDRIKSVLRGTSYGRMGKCPNILGKYIASAHFTPLVKPGGGIRPIVVGTVWRRLVSKVSAVMIGHSLDGYLDYIQFGVEVSGVGEAILHVVNRLIEDRGDDVGLLMLLVDFKKAFNLVDREVML
ncbi:hypothetical protein Tco_0553022 [Tanacetum coccineum]